MFRKIKIVNQRRKIKVLRSQSQPTKCRESDLNFLLLKKRNARIGSRDVNLDLVVGVMVATFLREFEIPLHLRKHYGQ